MRAFAGRLLRAAFNVLAVIGLVLLAGMVLQAIVEADQRRRIPALGQLIDVGNGQQIHIRVWGADNAGPTILLETSAAWMLSEWAWIGRDLGRDFRVVATDRPGMGWSVGGPQPRDALSAAEAFRAALDLSGIEPPYVVVGHSYGGLTARVFTGLYPDDVVGLVLLDTTTPDGPGIDYQAMLYGYFALLNHTGFNQVQPPPNDMVHLPAEEAEAARAVSLWTTHLDSTAEELAAWRNSFEQTRQAGTFGDLPVLIVSAAGGEQHLELQRNLTRLSTNSVYIHYPSLGHTAMLIFQDQAALVAREIREFVAALR